MLGGFIVTDSVFVGSVAGSSAGTSVDTSNVANGPRKLFKLCAVATHVITAPQISAVTTAVANRLIVPPIACSTEQAAYLRGVATGANSRAAHEGRRHPL